MLSAGNEDLRSCGLVPVEFWHENCAVTEKVRIVPFLVSCAVPAAAEGGVGLKPALREQGSWNIHVSFTWEGASYVRSCDCHFGWRVRCLGTLLLFCTVLACCEYFTASYHGYAGEGSEFDRNEEFTWCG